MNKIIKARKRKVFRRKLMRDLNEFATFIAFIGALLIFWLLMYLLA